METRHMKQIEECHLQLGDKIQDTLSKLIGIVTSLSIHLHGCITVGVKPMGLKHGLPLATQWFDAPQLIVVKDSAAEKSSGKDGGPKEHGSPERHES